MLGVVGLYPPGMLMHYRGDDGFCKAADCSGADAPWSIVGATAGVQHEHYGYDRRIFSDRIHGGSSALLVLIHPWILEFSFMAHGMNRW